MINTVTVYGVARIDEEGVATLENTLYADAMLAEAASNLSAVPFNPESTAEVWSFTLVRNCVQSKQDAIEFFSNRNGATALLSEVLPPAPIAEDAPAVNGTHLEAVR